MKKCKLKNIFAQYLEKYKKGVEKWIKK